MKRSIKLHLWGDQGRPTATVPSVWLWDLVEYLSRRRTNVHFTYGPDHFRVCFLSLDFAAARQLLQEWSDGLMEPAARETQSAAP